MTTPGSCAVYFLRQKSEVFDKFKEFEAMVTNDVGYKFGILRSDNGGEYNISGEFDSYLKLKGIRHELTIPPHTPQQNGVAERMNQTLREYAQSMMAHAQLSNYYWAEAVFAAAYLKNRTPSKAFQELTTLYERWYGKKPDLSHLHVFGCETYAHVPDSQHVKLDKKAEKMRFVGYSIHPIWYRLLNEETHSVVVRRDVTFNENDFGQSKSELHKELISFDLSEEPASMRQEELDTIEPDAEPEIQEYQTRSREAPVRFGFDEYVYTAAGDQHILEPSTLEEALVSEHSKEWKTAADAEYQSLMENST